MRIGTTRSEAPRSAVSRPRAAFLLHEVPVVGDHHDRVARRDAEAASRTRPASRARARPVARRSAATRPPSTPPASASGRFASSSARLRGRSGRRSRAARRCRPRRARRAAGARGSPPLAPRPRRRTREVDPGRQHDLGVEAAARLRDERRHVAAARRCTSPSCRRRPPSWRIDVAGAVAASTSASSPSGNGRPRRAAHEELRERARDRGAGRRRGAPRRRSATRALHLADGRCPANAVCDLVEHLDRLDAEAPQPLGPQRESTSCGRRRRSPGLHVDGAAARRRARCATSAALRVERGRGRRRRR